VEIGGTGLVNYGRGTRADHGQKEKRSRDPLSQPSPAPTTEPNR
jgi:hypothetical protein